MIFRFLRLAPLLFIFSFTGMAFAENRLKQFIDLHNQEREALNLPVLEWSDELAEGAQGWAVAMAFKNQVGQSGSGLGENVWSGENNSATLEDIFNLWTAQRDNFIAEQAVPNNCAISWENCAAYGQIVWSQTTHIGCAAAASVDKDYIVCRYNPPGNIEGQTAY